MSRRRPSRPIRAEATLDLSAPADPASGHHHARPAARGGVALDPGARGDPAQRRGPHRRRPSPWSTGSSGFDDTVLPQLENALIAGHDVILLGERGQAKTRIIRSLVGLLDEWLPIVAALRDQRRPLPTRLRGSPRTSWPRRATTPRVLGPPQRALRGEAGDPRHLHRGSHRRGRPDPGGRGPLPLRRAHHPLRPRAPAQPGHLRGQRAPRPGRADPGRPAQRPRGARRPDPRATGSASRSTSCWSPRPTPRTTPTADGSSPR